MGHMTTSILTPLLPTSERYVSVSDYVQEDRDSDEACVRGEHGPVFYRNGVPSMCEDCHA
jgi:hypothetical protein